ncbi:MAG TPA: DUF882 domain-containing protein [Devosia sp.]|nr:DUF882 domain-containing protein [Devosia sp.]
MRAVSAAIALLWLAAQGAPVTAGSGDRTLWLYHTHTHETARFTFKHNGQYDQKVLDQMNVFLADWRTHEPTHMDPHLFDLLWEVYQDVGGSQPYNIVSAYRTPATNAYLRSKSSGVAENSQHMLGHAMDVYIPGVPLATLRAAAMRHQVGGVGFYPTSGSPFVHMDTGGVRAWPRMTRAQLERVFPDGKTLHLPVDGKPLSDAGRRYAMAEWNQCHMVPCSGPITEPTVDQENGPIRVASLDPAQRSVATISITAPQPVSFPVPSATAATDPNAIVPFSKTPSLMVATRGTLPLDGQTALGAIARTLAPNAPAPSPRILMTPKDQVLTAYAPEIIPDPGAQRALELLIERETTASASLPKATPAPAAPEIRTASLGGTNGLTAVKNIFDMTWQAVTEANGRAAVASTLTSSAIDPNPVVGLLQRDIELVAPEIDHVNETLATPVPMTDMHYADMTEPEGYLDNAAELGPLANRIMLESDLVAPPRYDRFIVRSPMLVASR